MPEYGAELPFTVHKKPAEAGPLIGDCRQKRDIHAVVRKIPKAFITPEFVCATEKGVS